MGAALGTALLLPWWGSVAIFAALGLGLALPFVAVAFVPALRRRLPKPGPWMVRFQRFLAVPMAATVAGALWLLYRLSGPNGLLAGLVAGLLLAVLLVAVGRWQRKERKAWPLAIAGTLAAAALGIALLPTDRRESASVPAGATQWSEAAVDRTIASGRPAFVYFTADWCLSCKANEAAAIDRSETQRSFKEAGVETFVGDWTNGDPGIGRFLESRGRAGVPLYLWYAPGKAEPEELPQILTPRMLVERARSSSKR
jgi:thiol:disulfide interchange protein